MPDICAHWRRDACLKFAPVGGTMLQIRTRWRRDTANTRPMAGRCLKFVPGGGAMLEICARSGAMLEIRARHGGMLEICARSGAMLEILQ